MKALIVLADDFEDIEAVAAIDVLVRAGIEVVKVGLASKIASSAHGIKIMCDSLLGQTDTSKFDILVLPGGPGYRNLLNSAQVIKTIKDFNKAGKIIAAICAAPVVLAAAGILDDKTAVVYPGLEKNIPRVRDARVLVSKNVITSQGPGTALDFALMIVERTVGKSKAAKIRKSMIVGD